MIVDEQGVGKVCALFVCAENLCLDAHPFEKSDGPHELHKLRSIHERNTTTQELSHKFRLNQEVELCRLSKLQIPITFEHARARIERRYPEMRCDPGLTGEDATRNEGSNDCQEISPEARHAVLSVRSNE